MAQQQFVEFNEECGGFPLLGAGSVDTVVQGQNALDHTGLTVTGESSVKGFDEFAKTLFDGCFVGC